MRYPKFLAVCVVFVVLFIVLLVFVNKSHETFANVKTKGQVQVFTKKNTDKACDNVHCSIFRETSHYCKDISQVSNYIVKEIEPTSIGVKIILVNSNKSSEENVKYGKTLSKLTVVMTAQTKTRLHVKIFDVDEKRWQIPKWVVPIPDDPIELPLSVHYYVKYSSVGEPFNFAVIRKLNGDIIIDTCKAQELYFADQFLSFGTKLPTEYNIYGLGEHVVPSLRLPPRTYTLWNYDAQTPKYHNLYGSHPFYLEHRANGKSHGVFLRNSNGMDIILDRDSLTYNVLGGVFDFYFFLGPQPESVIQQYQEVIGRPKMPTYWGLGFHQCRYGYKNVQELQQVVKRFREESIPLDTMWTDIDYMNKYRDFTLSPVNFPELKMKEFVKDLHQNEQYYVVIIDPGIKIEEGYEPYSTGLKMDIFIKTYNGKIFNGKVWPGVTAFPDFFNPHINKYWEDEISKFRQLLPIDGIWLDMNEIASFHDGEMSDDKYPSTLNDPPYAIDNQGSKKPLMKKTVSPDAVHYGGLKEYDVHNLYGHTETMATSVALQNITKKRSFIIGRSTFPGTGSYGGHWTGDNHATWQDLGQSVIDVLNFQLYGIPFVGADICGFGGDTTEELCARWMALGAFYPFSRSHSQRKSKPQEPYLWKSVADVSRKVLSIRYSLLPYYYTLFYKASGPAEASSPTATVLRPLFFEFPNDPQTFYIHNQFMIGDALLVTPVLKKGVKEVKGYFPNAWWYDYHSLKKVTESQTTLKLATPLDHIQIHIRGGSVVPTQLPSLTTAATRRNKLLLFVALDSKGSAHGELYWDDGVSIKNDYFVLVHFDVNEGTLTSTAYGPQYNDELPVIGGVTVLGVKEESVKVTVNGIGHSGFTYDGNNGVVKIDELTLLMRSNFVISWIS